MIITQDPGNFHSYRARKGKNKVKANLYKDSDR